MNHENEKLGDLAKFLGLLSEVHLDIQVQKEMLNNAREIVLLIRDFINKGLLNQTNVSILCTSTNQQTVFEKFLENDLDPYSFKSKNIDLRLSQIDIARRLNLKLLSDYNLYRFLDSDELVLFDNYLNWGNKFPDNV